jgi:hypothetical protein
MMATVTLCTASPGASDVLVKYTYWGDANLDGQVDGSDYTRIDNGFLNHLSGWFNGDFNGDHVVDGSDYTLIDNDFNTQSARLAASIALPNAAVAEIQNAPQRTTASRNNPAAAAVIPTVKANGKRKEPGNARVLPSLFNTAATIAFPNAISESIEADLLNRDLVDRITDQALSFS